MPGSCRRRHSGAPESGYRVFEDLAGHPFCLVHGKQVPDPRFAAPDPGENGAHADR